MVGGIKIHVSRRTFDPEGGLGRDVVGEFDGVLGLVFERGVVDDQSVLTAVDEDRTAVVRHQLNTVLQPRHLLTGPGQLARHLDRLTLDRLDLLQRHRELDARLCVQHHHPDSENSSVKLGVLLYKF